MNNETLSPREIQAVQLMLLVTMAVFIGVRSLPARYRQRVGRALAVCYVTGVFLFAVYVIFR